MEISFIIIALLLGLTSSLHCIGMCGPIAFALGLDSGKKLDFILRNLTYQFGRVITYSLLGSVLGFIGYGISFSGFQNLFSIMIGMVMILMALLPKNLGERLTGMKSLSGWMYRLKSALAKFIRRKNYSSLFTTGLLNGLLPCGAVYAALTASLAMGSIPGGAVFMFAFGLGTIPLMFAAVLFGNLTGAGARQKILKFLPFVMILLGLLFIVRGLNFDIPYISPALESLQINGENHSH